MNRRQFTASLAALAATPALPLAARIPAAAAPAIPPGAHAWAYLIARAQINCSPDMLAKSLHLTPEAAKVVFKDLVVDGVLRAPGANGVARAVKPFETTGLERSPVQQLKSKAKDMVERAVNREEPATPRDEPHPLVNTDETGLGCGETQPEDLADVSPDQSPEESPELG